MNIRQIRLEDAEQFSQLLLTVDSSNLMLFEPGERKTSTEQEEKRIEGLLLQGNSTILVAEENDKLVGYLVVLGGQNQRNRHSAYIVIGVHQGFRGKGVGLQLFEEAFKWAREIGLTRFGLTVIKHNDRAIKLYEKMGFQVEGEKVHSLMINGEPVNELYFYKIL